jgi:hypothetical protein
MDGFYEKQRLREQYLPPSSHPHGQCSSSNNFYFNSHSSVTIFPVPLLSCNANARAQFKRGKARLSQSWQPSAK